MDRWRACLILFLRITTCAQGNEDEFEYFRCDACSATFFKVNKTLVERFGHRNSISLIPSFEFVEALDDICEKTFTKNEFGVKQHEGKKYLFGPGVVDHIPGKGFGQMGMGDYDQRLGSYCKMFIEEVVGGEAFIKQSFVENGFINKSALCEQECLSSASGTGPLPSGTRKRKSKKVLAPPAKISSKSLPPSGLPRKKLDPAPTKSQATRPQMTRTHQSQAHANNSSAEKPSLTRDADIAVTISTLPLLATPQLRLLGESVMAELARRASRDSGWQQAHPGREVPGSIAHEL